MGYRQLIPDIEDREFTHGQGHWTGDLSWSAEPYPGESPAILATINDEHLEATLILQYPYIKPVPKKLNHLIVPIYATYEPAPGITGDMTLTDGVYAYVNDHLGWFGPGYPFINEIVQELPEDWNVENTVLTIHFKSPNGYSAIFVLDNIALYIEVPTKIQYLPLVGVG